MARTIGTGEIPEARLGEFIGQRVYCVEVRSDNDVSRTCFADSRKALAFARGMAMRSAHAHHDDVDSARRLAEACRLFGATAWRVDAFECSVVPDGEGARLDGPWHWDDYCWRMTEIDWLRRALEGGAKAA